MAAAFAAHLGLPGPAAFIGDASLVVPRSRMDPDAFVVAEDGGELVGSAIGMRWGSLLVVGPVSVRPDMARRGIAGALVGALLEASPAPRAGLFTFADSPGHVRLYERHGFRAGEPVIVYGRAPRTGEEPPLASSGDEAGCRAVAEAAMPGLDLTRELRGVAGHGATVVLREPGGEIAGFAICHHGPGSEAGSSQCRVKFAAVRGAVERLHALLDACEAFAAARGAPSLRVGVNTARTEAHSVLRDRGLEVTLAGIAMHRGPGPATCRPDALVLDDWR
jgi:predicted N-acetyltransferase YhbS